MITTEVHRRLISDCNGAYAGRRDNGSILSGGGEQLEVERGRTREPAAPPQTKRGAAREPRAAPPEKDQSAQTKHLGMARFARYVWLEGSAQQKGALGGKIFARCIPRRLFARLFGCMARISCQNQPISDTWRRNVATNRRFSRPRPLRERMRRKKCHGSPPGNAPRRYLARAGSPKTRRGDILPRQAPLKNASRRHLAEKALGCPGLLRNRSGAT